MIGRRLFLLSLLVLIIGASSIPTRDAHAHSPDVSVAVRPEPADADHPLARRYLAEVKYTDSDPVLGARVSITGTRREGAGKTLGPIDFSPGDKPGVYLVEVTFPRYGNWDMTVVVTVPGKGAATFSEALEPVLPVNEGGGTTTTFTAYGSFGLAEAAQVVIRTVHSLAGVAWFGLSGVILSAHWLLPGSLRGRFLARLARPFLWISAASLALMLLSGLYSSVYSAPIRPPGIFNLAVVSRLPYGVPYLSVYFMKVGGFTLLAFVAYRMNNALRAIERRSSPSGAAVVVAAAQATRLDEAATLNRLAVLNAALGVLLVLAVVLLSYLHNISHLALVVPA